MTEPAALAGISKLQIAAGAAIIAVVALVLYWPSLRGPFILDDEFLTQHRLVKATNGLYRLWFTTEAADYWPVTNTSFWLEWRLWKSDPTGYHVTNLVLHIVDCLLLWVILKRLAIPGAFLAALLFAIHPVNMESVAWIAQRKNVLALLFFLLSVWWYLKAEGFNAPSTIGQQKFRRNWYWLSFFGFILAMLSKGSVAILPVVLLLIMWWQHGRIVKQDVLRTMPFFVIAVLLTLVNLWFRSHGVEPEIRHATFVERLLGAGGVVWFYLYKAIWPTNLLFVYPQWSIRLVDPLWWLPLLAAILATALLWYKRRTPWGRALLFAWLYYCVCLLPVMGFADVGFMQYSLVADHYQHLALVAVVALAGSAAALLCRRERSFGYPFVVAVCGSVIVILSVFTFRQAKLYGSPRAIYQATLDGNPECWLALNNLGKIEADDGNIDLAEADFRKALAIYPDSSNDHYNLAVQLAAKGRTDEAFAHYHEAVRLGPETVGLYNNLGQLESRTGKHQEALADYRRALKIDPEDADVHFNFGVELAADGNPTEAVEHYREALRLGLKSADLYNDLGLAEAETGHADDAIAHYQSAIELNPQFEPAHYNLAIELAAQGKLSEAISHYGTALRLGPVTADLYNNLGIAQAMSDRLDEAVQSFEAGHRLEPGNLQASINLASAYARQGRLPEAISLAEQAQSQAKAQHNDAIAEQIAEQISHFKTQLPSPGPTKSPANSTPPGKR
jgi:protein O-mannosyl-transferase